MRKHGKTLMHERDEEVKRMMADLPSWVTFARDATAKRICKALVNAGYRKGDSHERSKIHTGAVEPKHPAR